MRKKIVNRLNRVRFKFLTGMVISGFTLSTIALAAPPKPTTFTVNPVNLRKQLLTSDASVLLALNQVYQAKEAVNVARGGVLPSLNIGVVISSGPTFALTAITSLLSFLLPSNWFNLEAREHQLSANGTSFHIVQLNNYASAYGLYQTIITDMGLRDIFQKQYENLKEIQKVIDVRHQLGLETDVDLDQATAKMNLAHFQVHQLEELLGVEKATVRKMLGLPLSAKINFEVSHPAPLKEEKLSPEALLKLSYPKSLERRQVEELMAAAKAAKWSQVFGFISSPTISFGGGSGSDFGSVKASGSINLGFGYLPAIRLSDLQVEALEIHQKQVRLEAARVIESALYSIGKAQAQHKLASAAEASLDHAYKEILVQYASGATDLLHLLQASTDVTTASISRLRSQSDVDLQRLSLYRLMIAGQFAAIPGCKISRENDSSGNPFGWLPDLLFPDRTKVSIDDLCRGKN